MVTLEYVKQCEKAEEIQEQWGFKDGDLYFTQLDDETIISVLCDSCNVIDSYGGTTVGEYSPKGKYIWLPRQDQLQEMVKVKVTDVAILLDDFIGYYIQNWSFRADFWYNHTSMEQLWLSYVMKSLYQKVWSKGEWVKEN